jgi:hypothetical protein
LSIIKAHKAQSIQQGEQWAIVFGKVFLIIVKGDIYNAVDAIYILDGAKMIAYVNMSPTSP